MNIKRWATTLAVLALVLTFGAVAEANHCPDSGGTEFIVDDAADAAHIAGGYNNQTCHLIIRTSFTPTGQNTNIRAGQITIDGPGVVIQDPDGGSKLFFTAFNGNLTIDGADIRVTAEMALACAPANCLVDIKESVIIVSNTLAPTGTSGTLRITQGTGGPATPGAGIDIKTSTVFAGALMVIRSNNGFVTFICQPGTGGCLDPTVASPRPSGGNFPAILLTHCPDGQGGIQFPCDLPALSEDEIRSICIEGVDVQCGGASTQLDLIALTDVDITNSTINGLGIFNIDAKEGQVKAAGAVLTGKVFDITAGNKSKLSPAIDLTDAQITASGHLRIKVNPGGCPAALTDICVDARRAELLPGSGGARFKVNNDNASDGSFDTNTADNAGECTALGLGPIALAGKGQASFINADQSTGFVVVCEAVLGN